MCDLRWSSDPPTEPDWYWFCGELSRGSMGCHYREPVDPFEPKFALVSVRRCTNALVAVAGGRFVSIKPFDREQRKEGYVGYWARAKLPSSPVDTEKLFVPRKGD